MKLIKLDAIDSTNDFLKGLAANPDTVNYTVVTAENQTKGKGQRGAKWDSEIGKNLIVSILIKDLLKDVSSVFDLNIAVALSVISALEKIDIPNLSIKWPNDIMSDKKKVGGILIENLLKSDGSVVSVVGIGLNVNQINFEQLPQATSLAVIKNAEFDKEQVLFDLVKNLKNLTSDWRQDNIDVLWKEYNNILFKKGVPMPFENTENQKFMGIIQSVNSAGKLLVSLDDDSVKEFDIKEIKMLY